MKIEYAAAKACIVLVAMTLSTAAIAQARDRTNPPDAPVAAPAVKPGSAFSGYQPYREPPIKSWKDANQEVADNPGMGSMTGMSGMAGHSMPGMDSKGATGHDMSAMPGMPGMGSKPGAAPKAKTAAAAGHDMGSMQGMPGMDTKPGSAPKAKTGGTADHDMGSMQGMPGMASKPGVAPKPHGDDGHDRKTSSMQGMPGMASSSGTAPKTGHDMGSMQDMPGMTSKSGNAAGGPVSGTGIVKGVDKANGKVRLTHDPIEAMGWPKMTLFFRLKDNSLADRVREGDKVDFSLEKSATGYVISDLQKRAPNRETKPAKQDKP